MIPYRWRKIPITLTVGFLSSHRLVSAIIPTQRWLGKTVAVTNESDWRSVTVRFPGFATRLLFTSVFVHSNRVRGRSSNSQQFHPGVTCVAF